MKTFVCYDLRAIQAFIFRVPKLKYIVGGSAIIDRFDRDVAPRLAGDGVECIFGAGGKGGFACADVAAAERLEQELVRHAAQDGLDIRLGRSEDYCEASHCADRLHSYVPDALDGHPCEASGLYPVTDARGPNRGVHPIVERRITARGEPMHRRFETQLLDSDLDLGPAAIGLDPVFFRSVASDDAEALGAAGAAAIGGMRRWAVICMDGNDMGSQFREQSARLRGDADGLLRWIRAMSSSLGKCALMAARRGIESVVQIWIGGMTNEIRDRCSVDGQLVLPIRPLVVGGDDIVVLCHAAYAFDFVREASIAWARTAADGAREWAGGDLWPATGNSISISAGVLFAPSSMPLHVAIPYAESVLASAKQRGRSAKRNGEPSPASIDWESVTESILDHPAGRRQRELHFFDEDCDREVLLTRRPYTLEEFKKLTDDARSLGTGLPRSMWHEVRTALRAGWNDRELFRLRLGKRHEQLARLLDEGGAESSWMVNERQRSTWICDAISLLEEQVRHDGKEER